MQIKLLKDTSIQFPGAGVPNEFKAGVILLPNGIAERLILEGKARHPTEEDLKAPALRAGGFGKSKKVENV